jgi:thioesterase domain-containing protein
LFVCSKETRYLFDPRLLWRAVASEGIEVYRTPGRHAEMMKEPHVGTIVEKLSARLADAEASAVRV